MTQEKNIIDRSEISQYTKDWENFRDANINEDKFTALRLQQGIYGQRQDNKYMVRIKVPGGVLDIDQFNTTARLLNQFSDNDFASITTRQDIQLHNVSLENTPAIMGELADVGLTTREACGNTVRNVTGCPLAGVCSREHTDITQFLNTVVEHFLRHPLTQHLPRKFKMSFSGCEADCAQGLMHDLAVVAVKQDNQFGFKILAGGGLGHKPREAIVLESFLSPENLLASIEAAISVHHRYSNRKQRAKSRIKFLVDRFGEAGFIEKYQEEYRRTKETVLAEKLSSIQWFDDAWGEACGMGAPRKALEQRQKGLYAIPVNIPLGDLSIEMIQKISALMNDQHLTQMRMTQDQNLVLVDVPKDRVELIVQQLSEAGLSHVIDQKDVVACPGTWTCRLGITSSRGMANKLLKKDNELKIRVSGCHNGCAQPYVGDIGLHGEGRRMHGKLIPFYRMHFGGHGAEGGKIAIKGPEVPAVRVATAVERVQSHFKEERNEHEIFFDWARNKGAEYFGELLADLTTVTAEELPVLAKDIDNEEVFKVYQFGGGECAGISEETVSANFSEVKNEQSYRNAFLRQGMLQESLECAENILKLAGNSALFIAGEKSDDDLAQICQRLKEVMTPTDVVMKIESFVAKYTVLALELDKEANLAFFGELDKWVSEVEVICRNWQPKPKVRAKKATKKFHAVLDLTEEECPMHYLKARMALKKIGDKEILPIRLTQGEATRLVSDSLKSIGYEIIATEADNEQQTNLLKVRKAEAASLSSQGNGKSSLKEAVAD